jgi:hypothetical protein
MRRFRIIAAVICLLCGIHLNAQQIVIDPSQIAASATNAAEQIDYMLDQLGEFLGLDDHQKALVLSLNRGMNSRYRYKEVFISLGSKLSGVYATEVSPQEALAYESAQNKKKEMLELIQNTSPIRAIRQLTSRSHEKV